MPETGIILTGIGTLFGGIAAGFFGGKKLIVLRNNRNSRTNAVEKSNTSAIEKSEKTSGAKHISEEGLTKFNWIMETLETKYMTLEKHTDVCGKQQSDMKLYISNELKKSTETILTAIGKMKD